MPLPLTITEAGLAKIVNNAGQALGPVEIVSLGLTDTPFTLAPTLTALPGEFKRLTTVSGLVTGPSTLHIVAADSSADVYGYCGFALYLSDGTLFAVYGQPTDIAGKSAVSETWIALDIALSAGQAASVTFGNTNFVDPLASETVNGLVQLATLAEAQGGTDEQDVITPATARGAVVAWLQGQGGQGSGINADLLDGQQGAWYADIVSRLGFQPLAASAYTPADILAKLLGVDGAGTGLDADLLDGQQGAWYASAAAQAALSAALTAFTAQFAVSFANPGYIKLPGGFVVNFGLVDVSDDGSAAVEFVVPFTQAPSGAFANPISSAAITGQNAISSNVSAVTQTGMTVIHDEYAASWSTQSYWFAFGKWN